MNPWSHKTTFPVETVPWPRQFHSPLAMLHFYLSRLLHQNIIAWSGSARKSRCIPKSSNFKSKIGRNPSLIALVWHLIWDHDSLVVQLGGANTSQECWRALRVWGWGTCQSRWKLWVAFLGLSCLVLGCFLAAKVNTMEGDHGAVFVKSRTQGLNFYTQLPNRGYT